VVKILKIQDLDNIADQLKLQQGLIISLNHALYGGLNSENISHILNVTLSRDYSVDEEFTGAMDDYQNALDDLQRKHRKVQDLTYNRLNRLNKLKTQRKIDGSN